MASKQYPTRISNLNGEFYGYHIAMRKNYPSHWHTFYEFEYIRSGEYVHIVNNKKRLLSKGDLVFCTTSDIHAIEVADVAYISTIQFTENHLTETSKKIIRSLKSRDFSFDDKTAMLVREMIFQLNSFQANALPNNSDFIKNHIETILLYCAAADGIEDVKSDALAESVGYIDSNFRDPITQEQLATMTGLSTGAFSAAFHKKIGVTFQNYLIQKRLKWAATLLKTSTFTVTEIAFNSGFRSHSHFSSMFKKVYGMSPLDYRIKYSKGSEE